ncbi:MAG TPA: ABC transporter permease [Stenomitos sp.]
MTWQQRLWRNPLAKFGITVLLLLYIAVIGADFFAPYNPYESQLNGSLLPPTRIYWRAETGAWVSPYIYPTTQGPVDANTGNRLIEEDRQHPSNIRLLVKGSEYQILGTNWKSNLHLFGSDGPARLNLLGTDESGRDELSRLLYGGRVSLSIGLVGVAISFPIGMLVGGISGYFGGIIDSILMRLVEVLMTIPFIYLLVALNKVLADRTAELANSFPWLVTSSGRFALIVAITSLISWAGLARVIRGEVLSIKQREFVQAAKGMGAQPLYIIVRHILPQTATYMIISATLTIPSFIGAESVLSLIGLGIQQPDASWGNLLALATNASILVFQPWLLWPPALLIVLTVLSFNLLGDALRDALDPRTVRR